METPDGDGYLKNKVGKDDLCAQFEEFIEKNIPNARVTIRTVRQYSKLYIYRDTARVVAKLLYSDCKIALNRKLVNARKMFQWWR